MGCLSEKGRGKRERWFHRTIGLKALLQTGCVSPGDVFMDFLGSATCDHEIDLSLTSTLAFTLDHQRARRGRLARAEAAQRTRTRRISE